MSSMTNPINESPLGIGRVVLVVVVKSLVVSTAGLVFGALVTDG